MQVLVSIKDDLQELNSALNGGINSDTVDGVTASNIFFYSDYTSFLKVLPVIIISGILIGFLINSLGFSNTDAVAGELVKTSMDATAETTKRVVIPSFETLSRALEAR